MGEWNDDEYMPYAEEFYPLSKHFGGPGAAGLMDKKNLKGLVVHITDGNSLLPYLKTTWETRWASAHFAVDKGGTMAQYIPLSQRSWAIDGSMKDRLWYSVENVAVLGDSLTDMQIRTCGYLLNWMNGEFGVPFQVVQNPGDSGLAYHSFFTNSKPCPGQPVIDQLQQIVDFAISLNG
jgi:N-acetylmuramoyl-L-alanine amidase